MRIGSPNCSTGKFSYSTEEEAKDAVVQMRYIWKTMTFPYVCPECYQYHLTTTQGVTGDV